MIRAHAAPLVLLAVLVAITLWPVIIQPGGVLIGHAYGDMPDHFWGTWWFGNELLSGRFPLTTNVSHFPEALTLWYVDPIGALLALPAHPLGPAVAWNLLVAMQLFASTVAAYAIGFGATQDKAAGLVSAMVAGLSPYALGLVHSGLAECLTLTPVILFVPTALRALSMDPAGREPRPRDAVLAGLMLGAAGTGSSYYGIFGALFAVGTLLGPGWRARLRTMLKIVGIGTLVALPSAAMALASLGSGSAVNAANAPGWTSRLPATDILTFFHPGAYYFPDTVKAGNPGILHVNYLGWIAIILAFVAARGAFLRAGLAYFAFALGPRLAVNGQIITLAKTSILLPLGLLSFPGSPIGMIHQPYRMVAFILPWLGIAAAMGAMRLPAKFRPVLALAILAETLLLSPAQWPLATREVPNASVYADLDGPILDWPPDASRLNRDYLVDATAHGQAIPYGVNVFLPETLRTDPLIDGLLRALTNLDGRARNRDVPHMGGILKKPTKGKTQLATIGFAAVVVHKSALNDREWGRTHGLLLDSFGEPLREDAETAVWLVK